MRTVVFGMMGMLVGVVYVFVLMSMRVLVIGLRGGTTWACSRLERISVKFAFALF